MSHWTVGEGRSLPQTVVAEALARQDAERDAWLTAECKRTRWMEPGDLCKRGHPLDGWKQNGQGQTVRYCKTCKREAMRAHRKARAG